MAERLELPEKRVDCNHQIFKEDEEREGKEEENAAAWADICEATVWFLTASNFMQTTVKWCPRRSKI